MYNREFYEKKADSSLIDAESDIRYRKAIEICREDRFHNILEIGCYRSQLFDLLKKTGNNFAYYGIDIARGVFSLKKYQDDKNYHVITHNCSEGLPFKDETFSHVFMLEVLEHIENPVLVMKEIRRTLKSGGKLVLSVPNPYYYGELYSNIRHPRDTEGHFSSFTFQNLDAICRHEGFSLDKKRGTYMRLPFSKRILKTKYACIKSDNIFLSRSFIFRLTKV